MRTQAYLLTALALLAILTPQHGVSATLNPAELSSRNETKIVQADVLVEASSGQGERVAQGRGDEFGKAEALPTIAFWLALSGKIDLSRIAVQSNSTADRLSDLRWTQKNC
jgi:hypothetical protein